MPRTTRQVRIGDIAIGGGAPVSVQSMLTEPLERAERALAQARRLARAGCEIVRVAVPTRSAVSHLKWFVQRSPVPVVADVHYDARIAIAAVEDAAVHKVRINPGNLTNHRLLPALVRAAQARGIPLRIGLNAGSVSPRQRGRPLHRQPNELLFAAAIAAVKRLEDLGFRDIVVSAKSAGVPATIDIYRRLGEAIEYPLHLGVTAAGAARDATVKHAAAFGMLLTCGIGDTIRVSIAGDPVEEVRVGWAILRALGLRQRGAQVIACPTCARARADVARYAQRLEDMLERAYRKAGEADWPARIRTIAVMGCQVNGPGEAAACDLGIAFGDNTAVLFRCGLPFRRASHREALQLIMREVRQAIHEGQ